jgi:hypothetical protein
VVVVVQTLMEMVVQVVAPGHTQSRYSMCPQVSSSVMTLEQQDRQEQLPEELEEMELLPHLSVMDKIYLLVEAEVD